MPSLMFIVTSQHVPTYKLKYYKKMVFSIYNENKVNYKQNIIFVACKKNKKKIEV
jgi:hypothetical protein